MEKLSLKLLLPNIIHMLSQIYTELSLLGIIITQSESYWGSHKLFLLEKELTL